MRYSPSRWFLLLAAAAFLAGCVPPGPPIVQVPANPPSQAPSKQVEQCRAPSDTQGDDQGVYLPATLDRPPDPMASSGPEAVWHSFPRGGRVSPRDELREEGLTPARDDAAPDEQAYEAPEKPAQQSLDQALEDCGTSQDYWQKGDLENALDSLDQAYNLILSVDVGDDPALIQQKEDLRFMISKRILEIYASRNTVASGNHNAIPMVENQYVDKEIKLLTVTEKDFFLNAYRRSGRLRPIILEELKAAGLPEELSWLPLIESGFKLRALSTARALGPWQFIASTGYKFGLSRDQYIDERMDPLKSTIAAIAYLKELHEMFGDWTTVLAAYNCGEGKVLRTIRAGGVNYLDNFWDLYQRLPQETARYVPRFIASLLIINNPEKYGIVLPTPDPPLEYDSVAIHRRMHLVDVAKTLGVDEELIKDLNPELRHQITPEDLYTLRVPPGFGQTLLARVSQIPERSLPEQRAASQKFAYHKVRKGETLAAVAKRYKVDASLIAKTNHLSKKKYLIAGRTLKIPVTAGFVPPADTSAPARKAKAKKKEDVPVIHVVRGGDSLFNLARRYGTTAAAIKRANGLSGSRLLIGQKLTIPGAAGATVAEKARTYVVRIGDCPLAIAKTHNMNLDRFLSVNGLSKQSKIFPGQKVMVD